MLPISTPHKLSYPIVPHSVRCTTTIVFDTNTTQSHQPFIIINSITLSLPFFLTVPVTDFLLHYATKKKPRRAVEKNSFPGDPRFTFALLEHAEDVQALRENKYLSTNLLLDYLIHRGAPSPTPPLLPSQEEDISIPPLYICGLATTFFIEKRNSLLQLKSTSQKSLEII
jgi:hypothetical protein